MLIHEGEDGNETQQGDEAASAEFSGAWDDLDAAERGQPEETQGRAEEEEDGEAQGGDEAGQGKAEQADAPPSAAADEASGEDSDDLWASADPRLREAFEASERARAQAEHQARSNGGRAGQLAKELKELKAALAEQRDAGNATAKGDEATDREERLTQLREEYPEVAAPILDMIQRQEERLRELEGSKAAQAASELDAILEEQPKLLTDAHPDWQSVVQSTEWAEWLREAPPMVQTAMLETNGQRIVNAADCIAAINAFKAATDTGEPSAAEGLDQRRERQLRASSIPTTRAPAVKRERAETFESAWDEFDRLDRQRSQGRR